MKTASKRPTRTSLHRQAGAALVTALMFLVILTMLALSSMTSTTLEEKMAANSAEINRVFQAAETGLSIAFDDPQSFDTSNTEAKPYEEDIDIDTSSVNYQAVYRQKTEPPRQAGYEVGTAAAYHFSLQSTASSVVGAATKLNQGAYQIGPRG